MFSELRELCTYFLVEFIGAPIFVNGYIHTYVLSGTVTSLNISNLELITACPLYVTYLLSMLKIELDIVRSS